MKIAFKYSNILILTALLFHSCGESKQEQKAEENSKKPIVEQEKTLSGNSLQNTETQKMVKELQKLVIKDNANPNIYRNRNLAATYQRQMENVSPSERKTYWFNYCYQLLLGGENKKCIQELSTFFQGSEFPHATQLNQGTKPLFELYALAYLRLGETENCQLNHTAQSCIIPLRKEGIHQLKEGSQNAIQLYEVLQEKFPSPTYQWVINLAYMTLGEYPEKVPDQYFIEIPAQEEQSKFPAFQDISMNLGVAHDGYAGSVVADDFNNDGFLDLFMTSSGIEDNVQLFLNNQNGGYTNETVSSGLEGILGGFNCVQADYDNDGDVDIFLLRGAWLGKSGDHPNSLLQNQGDGTFQDVSRSANILSYHPTQTASWGDFNRDGFLDLFIGNESQRGNIHPCELYQNNGNGTFTEVGADYGLAFPAFVKAASWGDINNDGWPELYVSRLGGKNLLFKNEKGQFKEISEQAGVSLPIQSFPFWFWDVNNDGFEDLLVLTYDISEPGMAGQYAQELLGEKVTADKPLLYLNNGDETFTESAAQYGLSRPMAAMGSNFGDLDNDGFLDFYVGTGAPRYTAIVPNRMFRNIGGKRFEEVSSAGNFGHIQKGHGIAFADLDRDGDQDVYAVMGGVYEGDNFSNILYKNPLEQNKNNWIVLKLEGTKSNRSAIGARIQLTLENGRKIYRTINSGGTFGASPLQAEIGLGKATSINSLRIDWPNSKSQTFKSVETNQKLLIREGEKKLQKLVY